MTKIDRIGLPSDLNRRNFLIGSGAAGLAFGYVAVSGLNGISEALAAGKFEPTAWYSIAPDGKITVMVGKAEMGQHVSSAMAQIVAEELEADWRMMNIVLPDNDPKYNDPVLGALITGGSWSVRMNFDAMSRAGAAGRITLIDAGAAMMGVPAGECRASNSQVIHSKTGKKVSYAQDRRRRKGQQGLDRRRAEGDQAQDARPVHADRPVGAAARHSAQDQRHGQVRHRCHGARHALRQAGRAAGALRRHRDGGRRLRRPRRSRASSRR